MENQPDSRIQSCWGYILERIHPFQCIKTLSLCYKKTSLPGSALDPPSLGHKSYPLREEKHSFAHTIRTSFWCNSLIYWQQHIHNSFDAPSETLTIFLKKKKIQVIIMNNIMSLASERQKDGNEDDS